MSFIGSEPASPEPRRPKAQVPQQQNMADHGREPGSQAEERPARRRRSVRLPKFFILSAAIHGLLLVALARNWIASEHFFANNDRAIEVEFISVPATKANKQIVESTLIEKSDKARDDAFLGQQNQTVREQTRARNTAPFRDGRVASGSPHGRKKMELGALGVHMNLKPMGHLGPGELAATSDYLDEIKPGAQTLLNTREYAFFSFYQRVRRQLEQYWEPGLRRKINAMFERGRKLAAEQEHSTRILVVLNSEGTITKIQVESTSGLLDLDQAAVEAFNKAGPFPNPPKGMLEADGTVKVEWEFVLKT